jgi:DNA-binding transcriptional LysR family regulator
MDMPKDRNFSSNEIDLLLALASASSFSDAGEQLRITQSAVSRCVKEVEARLGKELLIRGKSGSRPTRALSALLPKLRTARRAMDALLQASQAAEEHSRRRREARARS